ncbi:acyltransferase family protein [Actinoplanes sp. ATCC 53533]|uniref:acyltransferase family protein n=1 Tax=Actinoplanes sp. ATCC 53533 TaxID=1288362 RepID=UPI0021042DE5|nr:acyltransferase family protein [Actinoplanes sp. ATCC 53533]
MSGSTPAGSTDPPRRERYFDVLRGVAFVRVVVFHMFPVAWLSMMFPAMGVMFALGGSPMAGSVDRSAEEAVFGRLRRLLPALWVLGAILMPVALLVGWPQRPGWVRLMLWVLPVAPPPGPEWAEPTVGLLWYLTYPWLVVLSPAAVWLYRRARVVTVALPLAALAVLKVLPWSFSDRFGSVVTDLLTFAACWILGFAYRHGDLQRIPAPLIVAVSAVCTTMGVVWTVTHPGEDSVDLPTLPLAYGVYSIGFVLLLLRSGHRWLARAPSVPHRGSEPAQRAP